MICFRRRVTGTFRFLQRDELHRSGRGYRPPAGRTSFPLFSQSKSGFVIEYAITTLIKADVLFIVQSPAVLDSSPASILAASSESGTKKKKKTQDEKQKAQTLNSFGIMSVKDSSSSEEQGKCSGFVCIDQG